MDDGEDSGQRVRMEWRKVLFNEGSEHKHSMFICNLLGGQVLAHSVQDRHKWQKITYGLVILQRRACGTKLFSASFKNTNIPTLAITDKRHIILAFLPPCRLQIARSTWISWLSLMMPDPSYNFSACGRSLYYFFLLSMSFLTKTCWARGDLSLW